MIWSALCLILVSCEAPVVDDFGVRLPEEPLAVNGCVVDTDGAPMEGVVVSDGYTVTQTDAEGRYEITATRCAAATRRSRLTNRSVISGKKVLPICGS